MIFEEDLELYEEDEASLARCPYCGKALPVSLESGLPPDGHIDECRACLQPLRLNLEFVGDVVTLRASPA